MDVVCLNRVIVKYLLFIINQYFLCVLSYGGAYQLPQPITGMDFQNVFVYKWQENSCAKSHAFVGKSQWVPADYFGIAYRNTEVYL